MYVQSSEVLCFPGGISGCEIITLHIVMLAAVLVSKILHLAFLCYAGMNRTEGNDVFE